MLEIKEKISCDVLVAGTGLAGLRAACTLAQKGKRVLLISKGPFGSGSSFYPLTAGLGSQMYDSEADKEVFLKELLDTGLGVADEKLCRILIEETPAVIKRQPEIGIHPYQSYVNRPACFAKRERILTSWGNWEQIREEAGENLSKYDTLTVMDFTDLLRVIVKDGAVAGAILCNEKEKLVYVDAAAVILATGGTCGLYKHCLNVSETCGSGHSIALDAGANLINLEFMQFIPGFTSPIYKLLFSETTLRRCISVKNADGEEILERYLPAGVKKEECLWDRALHGPFTCNDRSMYFDIAMMDDARKKHRECGFAIRFDPGIKDDSNGFIRNARDIYAKYGIDLSKDTIWLSSFAHCSNGGIEADEHARTSVRGLYAAGEAMGGVHGADRHGGMATAAALVFGEQAALDAVRYVDGLAERNTGDAASAFTDFLSWISSGGCGGLSPEEVMAVLAEGLWYEGNALRDVEGLNSLLVRIMEMKAEYNAMARIRCGDSIKKALQAFHSLRTAEAMVRAMLERTESRGPHFRSDFPEKHSEWDGKKVVLFEQNKKCNIIVRK